MRKQCLFLFVFIFSCFNLVKSQTQFWSDTFEDVGAPSSGARTPSQNFSCGGPATAYFFRTNTAGIALQSGVYSAFEGAKFWAGEDIDNGPTCVGGSISANQQVTWSGISIAGKTGLSFRGLFAANGTNVSTWEGTSFGASQDYLAVEYRIDGGPWLKALGFYATTTASSNSLSLDTNGDLIGDAGALGYAFTEFTVSLAGTGTTLDLRMNCFANGTATEELAIDNFRLYEITCTTPTLNLSGQTNVTCFGGSTGSATMSASGGAPFTYTWSPSGGNAASASGLSAGVYTCVTTNSCGLTASKTVTITQPSAAISTSTAVTNVLCFGGSTGSATITASGGTPGYTYLWSSSQTTSVISGLNAGIRTVTVTDANGCTSIKSITITQPATAVSTTTGVTNVLCFGGSNGSATVTASGGTSGYTYLWSTTATTSVITGQISGVKTVTVTDANSCTNINSVVITQPASSLSTSTAVTNVLCFGGSTGSATVTASGGTPGYSYLWSSSQTTSVISGLNAGIRTVTVTDANGCTSIKSITITQPATSVSSFTSATNVSCNGGSNGTATVNASGGTAGYTYLWSTAATTSVISGQTSGIKTVTVTDANGCTTVNSVNITQPIALTATQSQTNVLCNGGNTGYALVNASGGTGVLSYSWAPSGPPASSNPNLTAGNYTCYIVDINSCLLIKTFTITQPLAITASIVSTSSPGCSLSNGAITVSASGGTGSLTYSWSPIGGTSATATGLGAGSYTCTIKDANNCSINISQGLSNPNSPTINATTSNAGCAGQTNGSVTLNVIGGNPGYSYSWSPSVSTNSIATSLGAGVYNATVTDASNCTTSQSFTITSFSLPTVTANNSNSVICSGSSVTLSGSGALTYTWSGGVNNNVAFTPSVTSSFTVFGTDVNGCTNNAVTSITVNPTPTISVNSGSICPGQSFTISPTGAATYSFTCGSAVQSPTTSMICYVSGTSSLGCVSGTSAASNITVLPLPTIGILTPTTICDGSNPSLTAVGTSATYTWSGVCVSNNTLNPQVINSISSSCAGVYSVVGTHSNGCSNTATANIIITPNPTLSPVTSNSLICTLPVQQSATLSAGGGGPTWIWYPGSIMGCCPVVSPSVTTIYTVTTVSAMGCSATTTITQNVSTCLGLSEIVTPSNEFTFYPNPFTDKITIQIHSNLIRGEIGIFNTLGVPVQKVIIENEKTEVDLSNLSSGIYFIKSNSGTLKLIKE